MSAVTLGIVVAAVPAGFFLAGLYGDRVVGWVVFGVWAVVEAAARRAGQSLRAATSAARDAHERRQRVLERITVEPTADEDDPRTAVVVGP